MSPPRRTKSVVPLLLAVLAAACVEESPTAATEADVVAATRSGPRVNPRNADALTNTARGLGTLSNRSLSLAFMGPAIISNGTVQLGIWPEAHLNVPEGPLSTGGSPTNIIGLRYLPTGSEATAPGCLCEGWGVADALSGVRGYANEDWGGQFNLTVESFTQTPTEAISVTLVRDNRPGFGLNTFRVTHHYRPSAATQYLYEVNVKIENLAPYTVDMRYTRTMDWDIAPNTFSEYVTIQGTSSASNVLYASTNGFNTADPLAPRNDSGYHIGDGVNLGPDDHGAHFDFGFGLVPSGEVREFRTFYGAAGTQADAEFALTQVGAEVYSLGQANTNNCNFDGSCPWTPEPYNESPTGMVGALEGKPHTFIFGFASVGGDPVFEPVDIMLHIAPNPISLSKSDLISVWVPSSDDFDATAIIPASATLGNESDPEASIALRPDGTAWFMSGDFNRDGRMDRLLVFRRAALQASGDLTLGTTRLVLRASHTELGLIRAEGPVRVAR